MRETKKQSTDRWLGTASATNEKLRWPLLLGAAALLSGCAYSETNLSSAPSDQTIAATDEDTISASFPFEKKAIQVNGHKIAYVDVGEGPVVLFIHGNPTSSYLWRNVIPYVSDNHRAIAIDLIGMGDSEQADIGYTFGDHAAYVDGFIRELGLEDVTLVVHDWGSVLGMRYARLNEDNVRAIAFMEAVMPPAFPAPSYEAMGPELGEVFRNFRTDGVGEEMVLENNFFVEQMLPSLVIRGLTQEELEAYRAPFMTPDSRRPTLQWPREVPIGGEPAEATAAVLANGEWMTQTDKPKLFVRAEPGTLTPPPVIAYYEANFSNMETRVAGPGLHFFQEDSPHGLGRALSDWLDRLPSEE
ncbi:MAG: haloalkane dehalogenase [Erythrobacter sp.]|uniref:haloalkane dehalogenase n=1 Tax=Erythrobacter sp. TaxID=1042 RepID=UPI00260BAF41|nr:haloalkane dehalogenase [Erythrobacter sp.]MDJ0977165.1 haloalkane dehalogenase [Erythrobacter sp.]